MEMCGPEGAVWSHVQVGSAKNVPKSLFEMDHQGWPRTPSSLPGKDTAGRSNARALGHRVALGFRAP